MPKGTRRLVIGDVHGCFKTLRKLLFEQLNIRKDDEIYFLGDLVDRGPYPRKVVDMIMSLQGIGYNIKCIMGNHEYMLLQSLLSTKLFRMWLKNDARQTLTSFRISSALHLERHYLQFFLTMPFYIELDTFVLVHGGFNFDIDNPFDDTLSMLWMRNERVDLEKIGNRRMIVGHSPKTLNIIKGSLGKRRILLDGGCVYFDVNKELGYLCALDIDKMTLYTQRNIDYKI